MINKIYKVWLFHISSCVSQVKLGPVQYMLFVLVSIWDKARATFICHKKQKKGKKNNSSHSYQQVNSSYSYNMFHTTIILHTVCTLRWIVGTLKHVLWLYTIKPMKQSFHVNFFLSFLSVQLFNCRQPSETDLLDQLKYGAQVKDNTANYVMYLALCLEIALAGGRYFSYSFLLRRYTFTVLVL